MCRRHLPGRRGSGWRALSQKTCLGACLPAPRVTARAEGKYYEKQENPAGGRSADDRRRPHGRPLVLHQVGDKTVVVEVVHGDESAKEFTYHTDAEYLGQVLVEEKLVKGESSQFGLYITTVDGETAQESENQWWRVTQDGEMVNTGVDTTPVQDGDHFELTLSTF